MIWFQPENVRICILRRFKPIDKAQNIFIVKEKGLEDFISF